MEDKAVSKRNTECNVRVYYNESDFHVRARHRMTNEKAATVAMPSNIGKCMTGECTPAFTTPTTL